MATGYEHRPDDHDPRTPRSPRGIPASRRVWVRRPGESVEQMEARESARDREEAARAQERRAEERARAAYLRGLG